MELLREQICENRLSHSYIFESKNLGKAKDLAMSFSEEILKAKGNKKVLDRDLLFVEANKNTIPIDSVREMIGFFQTRPFYGDYKVAIIEDGSKLSTVSSNAMLKILEDLPSYGKIIILTRNAHELLPTIRSRCQILSFESNFDYNIDRNFAEGLVESFLNKDLTVLAKNREKIEEMKDYGQEFFSIAVAHLLKLRLTGQGYDDELIEKNVARAIDISNKLRNNVNFLLSVEYFALGFIE